MKATDWLAILGAWGIVGLLILVIWYDVRRMDKEGDDDNP